MNLAYLIRPGKLLKAGGLLLLWVLLAAFLGLGGCGQVKGVPAVWEPETYVPVTVQQLLNPAQSGLSSGQRVKAPAYFWEFLTYDPAMGRNYLNLAARPLTWRKLNWFAVYEKPQMRGYFDLMAVDREQRPAFRVKRLDRVLVYGELAKMGGGLLYVRVHRLENLEEDEGRPDAVPTP